MLPGAPARVTSPPGTHLPHVLLQLQAGSAEHAAALLAHLGRQEGAFARSALARGRGQVSRGKLHAIWSRLGSIRSRLGLGVGRFILWGGGGKTEAPDLVAHLIRKPPASLRAPRQTWYLLCPQPRHKFIFTGSAHGARPRPHWKQRPGHGPAASPTQCSLVGRQGLSCRLSSTCAQVHSARSMRTRSRRSRKKCPHSFFANIFYGFLTKKLAIS